LNKIFPDKAFIIVITAPSGTGKTTVIRGLCGLNDRLRYSISATTRPQRDQEVDGRDYFFLDEQEFERKINGGEFIEWAEVHGYRYGTLVSQVDGQLAQGYHVVMDVDVEGAKNLRLRYSDGVFIFLMPPSMEELKRRLILRRTEDSASLERRMKNSVMEIESFPYFDYLVANNKLEETLENISGIIRAEEMRVKRLPEPSCVLNLFLKSPEKEDRE
jgi:guanylate kinase